MLYLAYHNGMKSVVAPTDLVCYMGALWDNLIGVFVKQCINSVDFE